jgi:hypothetical protein
MSLSNSECLAKPNILLGWIRLRVTVQRLLLSCASTSARPLSSTRSASWYLNRSPFTGVTFLVSLYLGPIFFSSSAGMSSSESRPASIASFSCFWIVCLTVPRRQHDPGPSDQRARRVAVGDQGLKPRSAGGTKVKADVIASHATIITHRADVGKLLSGGEH